MRGRARRVARAAHRWLGLLLGIPLGLIALTGIAISYWHEIDRVAFGYPAQTSDPSPLSLDQRYQIARTACEGCGELLEVTPTQAADATSFYFAPAQSGINTVVIADGDGRVLSARDGDQDVVTLLYQFHSRLFMSRVGGPIVGAMGLALLGMSAVGVALWWPQGGRWRGSFRLHVLSGPVTRRYYELHRLVGLSCSSILAIVGICGAAMAFPGTLHQLLDVPEVEAPQGVSGQQEPLENIVHAAWALAPTCRFTDLVLPAAAMMMATVELKCPGERSRYGNTIVHVDRVTGSAMMAVDGRDHGRRWLLNYLVPLHSGYAFGSLGQFIFAVVALAPGLLTATGATLFARRRSNRPAFPEQP